MTDLAEEGTPIEIETFDRLASMFNNVDESGDEARNVLYQIGERPDAWLLMHDIIINSTSDMSKALALNIFAQGIRKSWNILSQQQKQQFTTFYFDFVIGAAENGVSQFIINYANEVLIEILKNEWPFNWPNFTHLIINESKRSEAVCINNLRILSTLSDEIHKTRDENLTSERLLELDQQLDKDFQLIFSHIENILEIAESAELRAEGLKALSHFLGWIDLRLIISSKLCSQRVPEFLPYEEFRVPVIDCFTAIANHRNASADGSMTQIFEMLVQNLSAFLQNQEDIQYLDPELSASIVNALTSFLLLDNCGLLQSSVTQYTQIALYWMATFVAFTVDETFHHCVEMWHTLARLARLDHHKISIPDEIVIPLRMFLVTSMARPTRFIVAFNNDNELVLADDKTDTQEDLFYQTMAATLQYLCHQANGPQLLDFIMEKIREPFSKESLPVYFSIGSIAGSFKQLEAKFIQDVLAVITESLDFTFQSPESVMAAAVFMYIASSYKYLFVKNWAILSEILNRMIAIMQHPIPQLQIFAVNCLLEMSKSCYNLINANLTQQWLQNITHFIQILPFEAIPSLFSMFALLVQKFTVGPQRNSLVQTLFGPPIDALNSSLATLANGLDDSHDFSMGIIVPLDALGKVVCISDENFFQAIVQIIGQCLSILNFYTSGIAEHGESFNLMRVKAALLKLMESFLITYPKTDASLDLFGKIIEDFVALPIPLRSASALDTIGAYIEKLGTESQEFLMPVLDNVVSPLMEAMGENMTDLPELRQSYFKLLQSIIIKALVLEQTEPFLLEKLIDSILFGVSHPQHAICEISLSTISDIVASVDKCPDESFKTSFYTAFFVPIIERLIEVLTDLSHKFIFTHIAQVFFHLMQIVWNGSVIIDSDIDPRVLVSERMAQKLISLFPTLNPEETLNFAQRLVNEHFNSEEFKVQLADFLISLRKASPKEGLLMALKNDTGMEEQQDDQEMTDNGEPPAFYQDGETQLQEF